MATIRVFNGEEMVAAGTLEITNLAPGLFIANANGQGVASAVALRVKGDGTQSYEPVAQYQNNQFVCQPIDLGPESDQVFLVLYGTGLRYRQNLLVVVTTMGGDVNGEALWRRSGN